MCIRDRCIYLAKVLSALRGPVWRQAFCQFHGMRCRINLDIGSNHDVISDFYLIAVDKGAVHIDRHIAAGNNITSIITPVSYTHLVLYPAINHLPCPEIRMIESNIPKTITIHSPADTSAKFITSPTFNLFVYCKLTIQKFC